MDYFFDEDDESNENIEVKDDMYNYKGYFVEHISLAKSDRNNPPLAIMGRDSCLGVAAKGLLQRPIADGTIIE